MASQRMLEFMLSLPLSVYAFDQPVKDRMLLYTSQPPAEPDPDASPYSVICTPGYTSRGIPSYLITFFCPRDSSFRMEIFTVQIRKDFWGRLPPVDWFSLIVDGAQRRSSFEYP